jgi:hypothetical protein
VVSPSPEPVILSRIGDRPRTDERVDADQGSAQSRRLAARCLTLPFILVKISCWWSLQQTVWGCSMKKPAFWKLSMGKNDFKDILEVLDWLRQGLVLVHSQTGKEQGPRFADSDRDGDFFYLCHGNRTQTHPRRGIILLGRFTGPFVPVRHHRWNNDGWVGRRFGWIKTATSCKKLIGEYNQGWTPRNNSTFTGVPAADLELFESAILIPYFDLTFSKLGLTAPWETDD